MHHSMLSLTHSLEYALKIDVAEKNNTNESGNKEQPTVAESRREKTNEKKMEWHELNSVSFVYFVARSFFYFRQRQHIQ